MDKVERPLSPHLQVYKWQWTMMFSIVHRSTGVALAVVNGQGLHLVSLSHELVEQDGGIHTSRMHDNRLHGLS